LCNKAKAAFIKETYGTDFKPGVHIYDAFPEELSSVCIVMFGRVRDEGADS
jgi:hypothetical protein